MNKIIFILALSLVINKLKAQWTTQFTLDMRSGYEYNIYSRTPYALDAEDDFLIGERSDHQWFF